MPFLKTPISRCSRRTALSLVAAATALAPQFSARAATVTWDVNPGVIGSQDGSGVWNNLNLANWWDGVANVQWRNSVPDSAIFGSASGVAGTVTLGSNISVDGITFAPASSGNYTIEGGGNTLTLVNTIIKGTASATLNVNLAGTTGLRVTNTGTIRLGGNNTYSGFTVAQGRILQLDSVGALGNSTQIVVIGNSASPLSTLLINVPDSISTTVGAGRSVTLSGSNIAFAGAVRGADNASNTWAGDVSLDSFGAQISGGQNGTLNMTGVISGGLPQLIFSTAANATTVLGAVNKYAGDTQIFNDAAGTTSTLKIGVNGAISPLSRLTVLAAPSAGAQVLDLNSHFLTLRSLDTSASPSTANSANSIVTNNGQFEATLTVGDPASVSNAFGGSLRDGVGKLALVKQGGNVQILGGANTYTGSTTVNQGTLQLGGVPQGSQHFNGANAVLSSTRYFLNGGLFVVDNLGTSNRNDARLPDNADLTFGGGRFHYQGTDSIGQNSSETVRNLLLNSGGVSEIRVSFGGLNAVTFNASQLTRAATGPAGFLSGNSLGRDATSTAGVARLLLASAPTLVGGTAPLSTGINAGAKDTRIVPFLIGEATLTTGGVGTSAGTPNTFVTYQTGTGFRPLNPTDEFTNNAIAAGANTRITAATAAGGNVAINSLLMDGGSLTIGQTLTNTSGAILFVNGDTISGGTLNFGGTEGLITVNATKSATIHSLISGTNGLTLSGPGSLELASINSNYSGNTTIRGGTLVVQSSSGLVNSGPIGQSALVLAGGGVRAGSAIPVTLGNPVQIIADSSIAAGGNSLTLTGSVTLTNGTHTLTNNASGAGSFTNFTGSIQDGGQFAGLTIAGPGSAPVILSGANTYTGPTSVLSGTLIVSGSLVGNTITSVGNPASPATVARLGGSGQVGSITVFGSGNPATSGATIDPGNSANVAGIMRASSLFLNDGAHLSLQIGGVTAGGETTTGYDQIIASNAVTFNGGDLQLSLLGTPVLPVGSKLFLIVNNSGSEVAGDFTTVNGAAFNPAAISVGGHLFQLAFNGNFAGPGSDGLANDMVLTVVPEPGSGLILASALGLLACRRRWA